MPVKRPNDTWAAAPESSYPKHGSLRVSSKSLRGPILTGVVALVTLAAGAGVFVALNAPRTQSTAAAATTVVAPAAITAASAQTDSQPDTPLAAEAPTPLPGQVSSPKLEGVSQTTASSALATPEPTLKPTAPAAAPVSAEPVIAPQLVAAATPAVPSPVLAQPQIAPLSQSPAPVAEVASAQTGIRSTVVVIAGHTYDCYGQVAHLACDLKQ